MAEFKSFFKKATGIEGERCKYPTRLDTYGCGCAHNCAYCYARSLLAFRGLWNPKAPAVADVDRIKRIIDRELDPGEVVRLGGMTDCFQPAELEHRITLATIDALNARRVGYLIVTKGDIVARPEYLAALDPALAHIQITVTSTDDRISRLIEPGAPLPGARISAIETLCAAGIDTAIRLSPFVPEFVEVEKIRAICCGKLQVEFLRVNNWIKKWLDATGLHVDLKYYAFNDGGYKHLPLFVKQKLLEAFENCGKEISVCEDVERHFLYWQDHFNPNPDDCCNLRK